MIFIGFMCLATCSFTHNSNNNSLKKTNAFVTQLLQFLEITRLLRLLLYFFPNFKCKENPYLAHVFKGCIAYLIINKFFLKSINIDKIYSYIYKIYNWYTYNIYSSISLFNSKYKYNIYLFSL